MNGENGQANTLAKRWLTILLLAGVLLLGQIIMLRKWRRIHQEDGSFLPSLFTVESNALVEEDWSFTDIPLLTKEDQLELKHRLQAASEKKVIVIWVQKYEETAPITVERNMCGNCEVTFDRDRIYDPRTGAVVFHFHDVDRYEMPPWRDPNHLYIWWTMESSVTLRVVRELNLFFEDEYNFNATMTYRRDSEFYQSYEFAYPTSITSIIRKNTLTPEELLKSKTKLALSVMSNCGYTPAAKLRFRMIQNLFNTGFKIDLYGGCFNKQFAKIWTMHNEELDEEFVLAARKYKFYFAFENSHMCKDYITEKFFSNSLRSLTVPVVWGAPKEDYLKVAPPGSFIYAEDFSSIEDLADYLNYLDKNDTAYLEYLSWLTMDPKEMPQYGRALGFCNICRALHGINVDDVYKDNYDSSKPERPLFTNGVAKRTMPSLRQWEFDGENPQCLSPLISLFQTLHQLKAYTLYETLKGILNRNKTSVDSHTDIDKLQDLPAEIPLENLSETLDRF